MMDVFIRMKFWIIVGAVVFVAVALFFVGPYRLMSQNAESFDELKSRAEDLGRYMRQDVKNEQWIEQQEKIQRNMERQLRQVQEELLSRDAQLEEHLDDPDSGSSGPLSFGQFPSAYDRVMDRLEEKLTDNVLQVASDSPLVREELGSEWLSDDVLHGYEKQVQVQRSVVDAIVDLNEEADVVPVFDTFRFKDKPQRFLSSAHDDHFDAISFELKVALEFEFYPLFLEHMMRIPLGPEFTSVSIDRYEDGGQKGGTQADGRDERYDRYQGERRGDERYDGYRGEGDRYSRSESEEESESEDAVEPVPNDLVSVTLNGYIPDYVEQDDDDDETGSSTRSGRERRR